MTTVTYAIIDTNDDVTDAPPELGGLITAFVSQGQLDFGDGSPSGIFAAAGLRFQGVAVPQGATIETATFSTRGYGGDGGTAWGDWHGVDEDDAPPWSVVGPLAAAKTSQSVPIVSAASNVVINYDFTDIVKAIVDRPGWASGNSIAIAGDPSSSAPGIINVYDFDDNPTRTATLSITYEDVSTPSVLPDNATQGHTSASPTLAAKSTVGPANTAHAHTTSSPAVSPKSIAAPTDAAHGHAATSPTLAPRSSVSPAAGSQGHVATQPTITAGAVLSANAAFHALAASQPSISPRASVSPTAALHGLASTAPTLTGVNSAVTPADAGQGQAATQPTIAASGVVSSSSGLHAHAASSPSIAARASVAPAGTMHGHQASSPVLVYSAAPSTIFPAPGGRHVVLQRLARHVALLPSARRVTLKRPVRFVRLA